MIDVEAQFPVLLERCLGIVRKAFPITGKKYVLFAANWRWENVGEGVQNDIAQQRAAKLKESSITAKLVADLTIKDLAGKVIDRADHHVLLRVPHVTARSSYIVNGKELQVVNQLRLRPGLYTRLSSDNNVETFVNTAAAGTYRIILDREKGAFLFRVGPSAHFPLPAVLRALGVSDDAMRKAWGQTIYDRSVEGLDYDHEIKKLLLKLRPSVKTAGPEETMKTVREFLESKPFDPKVNLITVGRAYAGITGEAFLEASKKCLGVSQGKQKADDTESLAFKSLHSLEDFVPERLEKSLQSIVWEIQHRIDREPKIAVAVHTGLFTDPVTSFFTTSEFARHTDQSNPIDMIGANFLTTTMGEGGIGSVHAVTDAVRLVHPSHAGVLDGVHTPEGCYSDDMEVMTREGWRKWQDVTTDTEFACLSDDGFLEFHRSTALIRKPYVGRMHGFRSETIEYLLTPEHRQWVRTDKPTYSTAPVKRGRVRGYRFETAAEMSTKKRVVRIAGHLPYAGEAAEEPLFYLPDIAKGSNAQKSLGPFDPVDWAEFLGWYLSEGCHSGEYVVEITQYESVHPEEVKRIGELLTRMGLAWSRSYKKFSVCGRQLVAYLSQFGLCRDKFIPNSIFELSAEARHAFLEAAMLGDGRKGRRGASGNAYCSTSRRMAEDIQRLAFSLGISSRIVFEPDARKPHYIGCWVVHMHTCTERYVFPKMRTPGDGQFTQDYDGEVFCATVPGNRLYVRRNNKGGFWSGNSKIGISGHLTIGAKKVGTEIHVPVIDARTGQRKTLSTKDLDTKVIAFPDQFDLTGKKPRPIATMVKGRKQAELGMFKASEVDYVFSNPQSFFSSTSNMVPFLHNDDGNRVGMADRHIEQTIGLKDPDAPLVQARFGARGYEEAIGHGLDPVSPVNGKVVKVTADQIIISDGKKQHVVGIHDNYPLNSDGFMHDTAVVKKGQTVKAGEVLARNSFTNGKGTLALGKNLRIAYMPYAGYNFEDGMVISQSAAQKLTSVHKYEEKLDRDSSTKIGMKLLLAHYPDQVKTVAKKDDYDSDGVIKPGAVVQEGALLIPAVRRQELHADYDYARLHRALSNQWLDVSLYWQNATPGTVIDVVRQHGFIKVILKTEEPARIGDKLSMRHGGKGIVTAILPDGEMYRDQSGAVMDVLFNPTGVVGRVNPGQMYEAAAGKVARTTGKTFYVDNFSSGSSLDKVKKALKDAGLNEHCEETVTDPATGKKFERVLVGDTHFLKLRHRVAKKFSARGVGGAYTLNEQPAKTEEGSAQRIGGLELYALLSGDATNFVKDAFGVKGQKNDAYWRAVQLGLPTPPPKPPMVSEKFLTYMQGAGIDLERRGVFLQAAPMTDAKVLASSNGAIKDPTVVTANDLKPEKGGLFDPAVTGGIGGEHWAHIELPEPIVHPLMAKAAASVLDIPEKDLAKLSEGGLGLLDGKLVDPTTKGAKTGGEAVRALLGAVDVEAELKKIGIEYGATRSAAKRDKLIKRRRFLEALKTLKLTPADAYTMKYVPVIPAKFRAVYPLPDGSLNVSDPIHGYREVLMVANALRDMKTMGLDRTKLTALRRDLSGAVAGLVGTQEPLTRSAHFKGFLAAVKGASNKSGFFQGRVMSRPQDLSARSTIIPDPKFGLDQVGIPEKMALTIYKPFVVRRLVGLGHKPIDAREMVEKGDPTALAALAAEVKERPVILNRAPSLHKFNVMGFKPTLIQGEAIKINPLVVSGYNADFDGDTMGVHVPITEAARKEVLEKMLPSKNLFSPANDRVVNQPTMEMVLGLYLMSNPVGTPVKAASLADVVRGYMAKKHAVNAAFTVGAKTVCAGQAILNQALPEYARIEGPMTKKVMSATIEKVARRDPKAAADVLNKLKDLGNHYVTEIGFSVSLRDLAIDTKHRDAILDRAVTRAKTIGFSQASNEAAKSISTMVHADHANRFVVMSTGSGALSSKAGSVNRLVATPVAVTDHKGDAIPVQIRKSYAEGHDLGSYWATLPGARKGMMDKGLSTADTGYLTKRLVQANIDTVVSEIDCGTTRGVTLPADNNDIIGRFMVGGRLAGKLITPEIARTLKGTVEVRSPLTCMAKRGICSKCFGLNENGQLYPVGYHLGVLAAQTIGEPSTQLSLKAFHVGGAVGQGSTNKGFHRVDQLFTLPDNVKGRAILSAESGKVTRVGANPLGGWDVYVGKTKHYVPHEVGLGVKQGQTVAAGDHLSARGDIRPQDVLETTGSVDRVRTTLINELHDNFSSSGVNIKRRIYETVVKPMTKWAKVTDAGGSTQFHPGDVVLVDRIEHENATLPANRKVMFEPMLVGVGKVPHLGDDFIGRMMHDRIIDTAREAAALGRRSNTGPDGHPVARLAFEGASQGGSPAGIRRKKVQ